MSCVRAIVCVRARGPQGLGKLRINTRTDDRAELDDKEEDAGGQHRDAVPQADDQPHACGIRPRAPRVSTASWRPRNAATRPTAHIRTEYHGQREGEERLQRVCMLAGQREGRRVLVVHLRAESR